MESRGMERLGGGVEMCRRQLRRRRSAIISGEVMARKNRGCSTSEAKRMVARAMKEKAEEEVQRGDCFFKKLRQFRKDAKDVSECPCIRDKDWKIHYEEAERAEIWKNHMEKIMNEENEWHDLLESTETVGPVNQISMAEILSALNSMNSS